MKYPLENSIAFRIRFVQALCAFAVIATSLASYADGEPLFEFNLGAGVGTVPDYPASDQHHIQKLALPFATYRGESVRANYEGVQADVVKKASLGLDASLAFSLPSSSENNNARRGMPNIDTLLELGPRVYLLIPTGSKNDFRLILPIRAVIATNLRTWTDRGMLVAPGFSLKIPLQENDKSSITTIFGAYFGTTRLNQYFYEVDPQFALADRPTFEAKPGYIGSRLSLTYAITFGRIKYFASAGAQSYKNASNSDSALHRKDHDATFVAGLIWSFFHSDARAKPLALKAQ